MAIVSELVAGHLEPNKSTSNYYMEKVVTRDVGSVFQRDCLAKRKVNSNESSGHDSEELEGVLVVVRFLVVNVDFFVDAQMNLSLMTPHYVTRSNIVRGHCFVFPFSDDECSFY